jgi:hypothetical protein
MERKMMWSVRAFVRRPAPHDARSGARAISIVAIVLSSAVGLSGCRSLYQAPPAVDTDGMVTKVVRAKREPDRLIAEDLSVCWVIPDVFAGIKPGDRWRCDWQRIPPGM